MSVEKSNEYLDIIKKDIVNHSKSAEDEHDYIINSTARYHGNYVRTCYMPKIFSEKEYNYFAEITDTLYSIFEKIINRYFDDESYRKRFGFDERLTELILRCDRRFLTIPIARIDIFYNEETGDFKFCEFNTDGSSAMNEDRELNNAVSKTKAFKEFTKNNVVKTCELFYSWIDAMEKMYAERKGGEKLDNVVIADFLESASMEEFEVFLSCFKDRGYNTEICEIRDMVYDGKNLYTPSGMKVNAIYRRAVTSDIMKHFDEVTDFISAVKDGNVVLFGDFFTQIAHNKILYKLMWEEDTLNMLDERQKEFIIKHVPKTFSAKDVSVKEITDNKDMYILKPEDSYGSKGVFPGISFTKAQWKDIVNNKVDFDNYIVQEFYTPYNSDNYILENGVLIRKPFYNLTGLYMYGAKLAGIYSRISKDPIISTQYNEMALPTIIIPNEKINI